MTPLPETLAHLEAERAWFLSQLAGSRAGTPLAADEWSIAQTVEHLILVERGFLAALMRAKDPMPARSPEQDEMRSKVNAFLRTGEKYEVPVSGVDPGPHPEPDQLRTDWAKVRERLHARVEAGLPGPETLAALHPIAGPLNAHEALEFLANHLVYHRLRLEQLLAQNQTV